MGFVRPISGLDEIKPDVILLRAVVLLGACSAFAVRLATTSYCIRTRRGFTAWIVQQSCS